MEACSLLPAQLCCDYTENHCPTHKVYLLHSFRGHRLLRIIWGVFIGLNLRHELVIAHALRSEPLLRHSVGNSVREATTRISSSNMTFPRSVLQNVDTTATLILDTQQRRICTTRVQNPTTYIAVHDAETCYYHPYIQLLCDLSRLIYDSLGRW